MILIWAATLQSWIIFLKGFLTCASLIVAIGAQTSFVLRQGILRRHIFLTAITCVICDAILICLGVFGMGRLVALNPWFERLICVAGALFLIWFGLRAIAGSPGNIDAWGGRGCKRYGPRHDRGRGRIQRSVKRE